MFRTKFRHVIGATMVVAMVFGSVGVAYSAEKVVWNFNVGAVNALSQRASK